MAARKLQMEIDKALKKVAEGVDEFKVMVDKLNQAASAAQREKIEAELKRDIKKLQRMRDQIKTWIGSSEIKDKTALLDNRRLIETQMELFKAIEKELKTKAFSKEGLGLPTKIDPEEEKKEQCAEWIKNTFDRLNQHIDGYEAQQEAILVSSGKRVSKKANLANQEQIDKLKHFIHIHREHIRNLEIALRMLENGMLDADKIDELRESIDFFLDSCMDMGNNNDDVEDYLDIYDDLGLEHAAEEEIFAGPPLAPTSLVATVSATSSTAASIPMPPITAVPPSSTTPLSKSGSSSLVNSPKLGRASSVSSIITESVLALTSSLSSTPDTSSTPATMYATQDVPISPLTTAVPPPAQPPKVTAWNQKVKDGAACKDGQEDVYSMDGVSLAPQSAPPQTLDMSALSTPMSSPTPTQNRSKSYSTKSITPIAEHGPGSTSSCRSSVSPTSVTQTPTRASLVPKLVSHHSTSIPEHPGPSSQSRRPSSALATSKSVELPVPTRSISPPSSPPHPPPPLLASTFSSHSQVNELGTTPLSYDPRCPESIRDLLAVFRAVKQSVVTRNLSHGNTPLSNGPAKSNKAIGIVEQSQWPMSAATSDLGGMLDATWTYAPGISDTERINVYKPTQPVAVPPYYPTTPVPIMTDPRIYEKMDLDTLFYIFYFRQGMTCQYLAARELKRQSWRFHKKYSTWFQRHEEPREITPEFEAGAYIYFDWEVGWCQRKKPEFKFEYRYLEDADLE